MPKIPTGKAERVLKIVKKAKAYGIPLFQNEILVEVLTKQKVDAKIDLELFKSVEEIFMWLANTEESIELSSL